MEVDLRLGKEQVLIIEIRVKIQIIAPVLKNLYQVTCEVQVRQDLKKDLEAFKENHHRSLNCQRTIVHHKCAIILWEAKTSKIGYRQELHDLEHNVNHQTQDSTANHPHLQVPTITKDHHQTEVESQISVVVRDFRERHLVSK